ncbi:MAG: primosomal protein N' [Clostridia bacterium]|nr:primosomal protein N' [Clostridia bacterium]
MLTVGVALENTAYHFDKLYDYAVPADLAEKAKPGVRVLVPFGKSNAGRQGLILRVNDAAPDTKLKNISQLKDDEPLIDGDLLKLVFWLKDRTFCTYFEAFRCIVPTGIGLKLSYCFGADPNYETEADSLPADEKEIYFSLLKTCRFVEKSKLLSAFGFKSDAIILDKMFKKGALLRNIDAQRNVADKTQTLYRLTVDSAELEKFDTALTAKQKSVCSLLASTGGASIKEICYFTGVTGAVVKTLERKNLVEQVEYEVYRSPLEHKKSVNRPEIVLSEEQQQVFDSLCEQMNGRKKNVSLLYGITGSGKTQIYIKLIEKTISGGKSAIMMVPEIALTPQIIDRFRSHFGEKIAVFHSALSLGERTDEWKRVSRGEADVVIGTRSAVFAPLKNLGLIIVDEEQEHTYKSEQTPRYNAKEVARFRCEENNAALVLGSATPDVETFARAKKGIYNLNTLKSRYAGATLPEVIVADMAYEGDNTLSSKLVSAIKETLDNKQQAILLINRRGYNTFASCKACKTVVTCPNCSISLTYHHANSRLMCHYCGYSQPLSDRCPECEKQELVYAGFGTQLVEDELAQLFPDARILRMDQDTTMRKNAHEKALTAFADGEYDILLGTQMVAKGIDFENVTLVGVISVDQQLYNDDFRSLERTFSLLTQVVGRAGRGKTKGKAIIQTLTPENEIIRQASAQDYDAFFDSEITMRRMMTYPPFCDLCVVGFSGEDENKVRLVSRLFFGRFKELASSEYKNQKVIVLGPLQPRLAKISNKFRYRMIIKCKNSPEFRELISRLLVEFGKDTKFGDVNVFADINPESIL